MYLSRIFKRLYYFSWRSLGFDETLEMVLNTINILSTLHQFRHAVNAISLKQENLAIWLNF